MHRYTFMKSVKLLLLLVVLCFLLLNVYLAIEYFEETIYNYKMSSKMQHDLKSPSCNFGTYLSNKLEYKANITREMNWSSLEANEHLYCERLSSCDQEAIRDYLTNGRIVVNQEPELPMDCDSVKKRIYSYSHRQYSTDTPYAIASNVYKDYYTIEMIMGVTYSTNNSYCYALDEDSDSKFKDKMRQMAYCMDNVKVLEQEFAFDSMGHFQDHAHFRCTQELLRVGNWRYVLFLQNHDFLIRTNSEMSQIMKLLNGSQLHEYNLPYGNRFNRNITWTAGELKLFKDESSRTSEQLNIRLRIRKSPNQVFLSREFVTALNSELDMDKIMDAFNVKELYGTDEMLFSTLAMAYHLGLPGQASQRCPKSLEIMRYVHWSSRDHRCLTTHKRHHVCITTIEYLPHIVDHPGIIANKIQPEIDMGPLICLAQQLKQRAQSVIKSKNIDRYEDYPMVRERRLRANGHFNPDTFKC